MKAPSGDIAGAADGAISGAAPPGDIPHAASRSDGFQERLAAGRAVRSRGDLGAAANHFRAAMLARPGHVGARLELAHALLKRGDAAGAATLAAAAAADAPDNVLAQLRLGEARRALGDPAGALAAFAAAIRADPRHDRARAEHAAMLRALAPEPPLDTATSVASPAAAVAELRRLLRAGDPEAALARHAGHPARTTDPALWALGVELSIGQGQLGAAAAALAAPPACTGSAAALPHLGAARLAEARWEPRAAWLHHAEALPLLPDRARTALDRARLALLLLEPLQAQAALRDAPAPASRPATLLGEAGLDLPVLARLLALRGQPPAARAAGLAALARAAPELTLGAAGLLLALRQCPGAIAGGTPAVAARSPAMPRRVAAWGPLLAADWPADVAVLGFDEAAAARFIAAAVANGRFATLAGGATALSPGGEPGGANWGAAWGATWGAAEGATEALDVGAAFAQADPMRRQDLLRWAWLFAEGGLWVEGGSRPRREAPAFWPEGPLTARLEPGALLGTGWLAAAPAEPVIGRALAGAVRAVREGARDPPWLATGSGLLTRAFVAEYLAAADPAAWLRQRRVLDWHAVPVAQPAPQPARSAAVADRLVLELPEWTTLTLSDILPDTG